MESLLKTSYLIDENFITSNLSYGVFIRFDSIKDVWRIMVVDKSMNCFCSEYNYEELKSFSSKARYTSESKFLSCLRSALCNDDFGINADDDDKISIVIPKSINSPTKMKQTIFPLLKVTSQHANIVSHLFFDILSKTISLQKNNQKAEDLIKQQKLDLDSNNAFFRPIKRKSNESKLASMASKPGMSFVNPGLRKKPRSTGVEYDESDSDS